MRTVKGCEDVTMPFWDEFFYYNGDPNKPGPAKAIPAVLTDEFWPPGSKNKNPLRSYHFPRHLVDAASHNQVYNKHKDYETVRFPYSGLVGTDAAKKDTEQWNAQYSTLDAVDILNTNVSRWLNQGIKIDPKGGVKNPDTYSTGARYARCMDAPNYMVFSNKSSAQQYMTDHDIEVKDHFVVSLEDPHNAIHLSLGGVNQ